MRAMRKAVTVVAALGIAFGVAACGPETESSEPGVIKSVDASLKTDLSNVATVMELLGGGGEYSRFEVAPTMPGGRIDFGNTPRNDGNLVASPGNVIAVKAVENGREYCISGYNTSATSATSATKSLLYQSNKGGIQAGVGAC